jgi:hypothetical protein
MVDIIGADTNCTITLAQGSGSCNVVFNTDGARILTAVYSGDSSYYSSWDTESHVVSTAGVTGLVTITADTPDPSTPGQMVSVSVTVSGAGMVPTGTVVITGADTNCIITLFGGSGSCNVVFNSDGTRILTAVYSGDSSFYSSWDTESHLVSTAMAQGTRIIKADAPVLSGCFEIFPAKLCKTLRSIVVKEFTHRMGERL